MAKAAKLNMAILASVVAAGPNGMFGPADEAQAFVDEGLMEVNPSIVDANGNIAVRATAAGVARINESGEEVEIGGGYAIATFDDEVLAEAETRKRKTGPKGSKYPFDDLEVKQGFFVPVSDDMPNPRRSMSSSITAAQNRYAEDTGETEMKPVYEGKGEDRVQVGEKEVPIMKKTRTFKMIDRDNGVLIVRTA